MVVATASDAAPFGRDVPAIVAAGLAPAIVAAGLAPALSEKRPQGSQLQNPIRNK
ncbi:hypothetical protein KKE26_00655 [bacterium]|nr:hypothetical protein [bacterium]MBU1753490.1 hypothetical protein [bacterium]